MPYPDLKLRRHATDPAAVRNSQNHATRTAANPQSQIRSPQSKRASWLGLAGGLLSQLLGGRRPPVLSEDLKRHDYPTSTQRMGVRFTERIRDTFRFRWLRKM